MSELTTKEVNFRVQCPKCAHYEDRAEDEPCNECLTQGFNYGSHKPIKYEEKDDGAKKRVV